MRSKVVKRDGTEVRLERVGRVDLALAYRHNLRNCGDGVRRHAPPTTALRWWSAADDPYQKEFPWVGAKKMAEALGNVPEGFFR